MSVLGREEGFTVKYGLSPMDFPREIQKWSVIEADEGIFYGIFIFCNSNTDERIIL